MARVAIRLPRAMEAGQECLPHAAMSLGAAWGSGIRPEPGLVRSLVLEEQFGNWVLYRLDEGGGFVGDTWHGSKEDALWQIEKEFGVEAARVAAGAK